MFSCEFCQIFKNNYIIANFSCNICFSLKLQIKGKERQLLLCIFLMFLTSLQTTVIFAAILSWLDINPRIFSKSSWFLKTVKNFFIPSNSLLYLQKHLTNQNNNYIFIIRKDWNFAISSCIKSWKFSSSFIFNFNSSHFQNILYCKIALDGGFLATPIVLVSYKCSKNTMGQKI